MADALASGASVLRDVGVQVPLRPQVVWAGKPNDKGRRPYGVSGLYAFDGGVESRERWLPVSIRIEQAPGQRGLQRAQCTGRNVISLHIAAFGYECSCTECGLALVSP